MIVTVSTGTLGETGDLLALGFVEHLLEVSRPVFIPTDDTVLECAQQFARRALAREHRSTTLLETPRGQ